MNSKNLVAKTMHYPLPTGTEQLYLLSLNNYIYKNIPYESVGLTFASNTCK